MSNQFDRHALDDALTHNANLKVGGLETPCNEPIAVTKEELDLLIVAVTLAEAHATKRRPAYRELRVRLQSRELEEGPGTIKAFKTIMDALPKEPSQWAVEACGKLSYVAYNFTPVALPVIQHAIDQACAEKDSFIKIQESWLREKDAEIARFHAERQELRSILQQGKTATSEFDMESLVSAAKRQMQEITRLQDWKTSALKVMPEFQTIGALLGVPLGEDVSSNIIPCVTKLKEHNAALRALLERVPHVHPMPPPSIADEYPKCVWSATCVRCAYEMTLAHEKLAREAKAKTQA